MHNFIIFFLSEQLNIDEEFRRMRQEIAERAKKREEERLERQKEKELKKEELKNRADKNRQKRKEVCCKYVIQQFLWYNKKGSPQ